MALKNQLEHYRRSSRLLLVTLMCMSVAIAALGLGLYKMSEVRRIYIPPSFRVGAVLDGREIPPATVYAFATTIWQQLHRWREDGEKDYYDNVVSLAYYFTPRFRESLVKDIKERKTAARGRVNELRGRERTVSLPEDFVYQTELVETRDDGSWIVNLDLDLEETYEGLTVKKVRIRYPLHIRRFEVDWQKNPWGLAITGYGPEGPRRLSPDDERAVSME